MMKWVFISSLIFGSWPSLGSKDCLESFQEEEIAEFEKNSASLKDSPYPDQVNFDSSILEILFAHPDIDLSKSTNRNAFLNLLSSGIKVLDLSQRLSQFLEKNQISMIIDLVSLTEKDLLGLGVSLEQVKEIEHQLKKRNLHLDM